MDVYKYRPIDLDRPAVRLVRLLRGNVADEIQCELFDGWIDQFEGGIPYDALSYTWGSTEKAAEIRVDDSTMHVTSNLFEALRHLRFEYEDRILWVDAICIDQDNPHERTHQVQHMGYIYKEAEQVVIWLGQGTEETDFVMDSIKRLHEHNVKVEGDWRRLAHHWIDHRPVVQSNLEDVNRWREGMELMLKRPWFSRIWILQEIANARIAKVTCGEKSVSARTFAQFPPLIGLTPNPHCQAILDIMPGLSRKESWWSDERNLHTLLLKFRGSLATDERDVVYALLGMSSDACSSGILRPDYTKSLHQVIRDTVSFLLPQINQDESFYNFLSWKLSEFLRNLELLENAVLESAVENGGEVAVKLLLEKSAQLEMKNGDGRTPLSWASESRSEAIVKLLLDKGAQLETADNDGRTPLSWASKSGNETIVKLLLEKGAQLETRDILRRTPLSWASKSGNEAIVRLLLERGAELEAEDNWRRTPLSWAVTGRNKAIVELLLEKGARLETKDSNERTLLSWASESRSEAIVELLLDKGAQIETKDNFRQTPLLWASKSGNETIVNLLLEKGAQLETRDILRRTPLSWASKSGNEAIVRLLLKKGAQLEVKDNLRRTPLSWASESGNEAIVRLLLEKGAELEAEDNWRRTPLSWASKSKNEAIVKLLLEKGAQLEQRII